MTADVSVVIPTIGRAEVKRAVTSVLEQIDPPREVIVVDNGPAAGPEARRADLEQLVGARLPFAWVSLPPRSGPGISRNVGAWHARGRYVAFLDDDDEFDPDYISVVWERIRSEAPDVIYTRKIRLTADGGIRRQKRLDKYPADQWLQRFYMQQNHGVGGQNVIAEREKFFSVGGFPVDLRTGQDRGFAIAALRAQCHVIYVSEAVVRCHPPDGYRAKGDTTRWVTYLKILVDNWDDMTWRTRMVSTRKTAKSFLAHVYRRLRAARQRTADQ